MKRDVAEPLHWAGEDWPRYLDAPVVRPRTTIAVVGAFAVGAVFDLAVRSGIAGVAGALAVAAVVVVLLAGRPPNRQTYVLAAAALLFAAWLPVRASAWLLVPDILAVLGLVAVAASLAPGGSVWKLSLSGIVARGVQAVVQIPFAPSFLLRSPQREQRRTTAVVRGIVLAVPIVIVLIALLASADAVFASFVRFDVDDLVAHVALIAFGTLAMATLLRLAALAHVEEPRVPRVRLGAPEWTVVLVALNAVLAAFAIARLVSLTEGGQRVIHSAGLTYAEYARSGFFQLVGAAVLTTVALLTLRAVADTQTSRQRSLFVGLALGVVALTLAMVVSAFHRLVLYEGAFGLTMLRIYVQAMIVWIGIVLVQLGARITRVGGDRGWLPAAAGASALVLLFALNVMNPEALVARHNIAHQQEAADFDVPYLADLSADAVPELSRHAALRTHICSSRHHPYEGWAAYNLARDRAEDIRGRLCRSGG